MLRLKCNRAHNCDDDDAPRSSLSVVITLDQTIFKRELMYVFMDRFVTSKSIKKRSCNTV